VVPYREILPIAVSSKSTCVRAIISNDKCSDRITFGNVNYQINRSRVAVVTVVDGLCVPPNVMVAVWHNAINEVTLHRNRLVLGCVTVREYTVFVFDEVA